MTSVGSDLYLASTSPRRAELLHQIGVKHKVLAVSVSEFRSINETPLDYVQRLALEKAMAGWSVLTQKNLPLAPVLGADTLGVIGDQVLEKPLDQAHAHQMLRLLSNRTHEVITAVALVNERRQRVVVSRTQVNFRELSDHEIAAYWATGEPQDKAGGYAIQGLGAVFVKDIIGSYSGVVGLPLEIAFDLLREFNVPWWCKSSEEPVVGR